jgi:hypothetical protein
MTDNLRIIEIGWGIVRDDEASHRVFAALSTDEKVLAYFVFKMAIKGAYWICSDSEDINRRAIEIAKLLGATYEYSVDPLGTRHGKAAMIFHGVPAMLLTRDGGVQ